MKVHSVMNRYNYNLLTPATKNNANKLSFGHYNDDLGGIDDNNHDINLAPDEYYIYEPGKQFSPQRQAIENSYGKKMAELSNFAETVGMTPNEYEIRLAAIKRERARAIKMLKDHFSL